MEAAGQESSWLNIFVLDAHGESTGFVHNTSRFDQSMKVDDQGVYVEKELVRCHGDHSVGKMREVTLTEGTKSCR